MEPDVLGVRIESFLVVFCVDGGGISRDFSSLRSMLAGTGENCFFSGA